MQEYHDDVVITLDDDIILPKTALEELYSCWNKNKNSIICRRAHLITFDNKFQINEYKNWIFEYDLLIGEPSLQLFATACSGILYPPNCFPKETFNEQEIRSLCLYADDLWIKVQQLLYNIPIVLTGKNKPLKYIPSTQASGLFHQNLFKQRNDLYLKKISQYLDVRYNEKNFLLNKILNPLTGSNLYSTPLLLNNILQLKNSYNGIRKKYELVLNSRELKFGRFFLKIPILIYRKVTYKHTEQI